MTEDARDHSRSLPVAGIVLAGGLSRRMGGMDKAAIRLGDQTLLCRAVERLSGQAEPLAINTNGDPSRFSLQDLPVIADIMPGHAGPLAGIHAGMVWASSLHTTPAYVVSVPVDTPFFPRNLVARLTEASARNGGSVALAASPSGTHPVFGLWPVALAAELDRWLQSSPTLSVMAFASQCGHASALFENGPDGDPFFNINTPDDLAMAQARLSSSLK